MFEGSKFLARQLMRQLIWETLNRHQSGEGADIALIGSRRSGSTLLMQILSHHRGMKSIDQPFSVFTATGAQMNYLPWPKGGFFFQPDQEETTQIKHYLAALRSGKLHVQEPWRFWRSDFHFRSDRLVLKTTDAHYLLPLLNDLGFQTALYLRHPVPQALSCMHNSWGDKLEYFARNQVFTETALTDQQREKIEDLRSNVSPTNQIERYIFGWCLENLPLFEAIQNNVPTFYYEDIVLNPNASLDRMQQVFDIKISDRMRSMMAQPSVSVRGLSDPEGASAIAAGDKEKLVGRWLGSIERPELLRIQEILNLFPSCPYHTSQVLPAFSDHQ